MSNKHEKKFIINMFFGLLFTTAGITSIIYACFTKENEHDWIFWALVPVIISCLEVRNLWRVPKIRNDDNMIIRINAFLREKESFQPNIPQSVADIISDMNILVLCVNLVCQFHR